MSEKVKNSLKSPIFHPKWGFCGERYFHAKTLDAIDDYLSKKHTVKAHIDVEIVSFSQAVA
ncbi:MAG: hypothetical protein U9O82_12270 [Thermodesulfobacteriota bacterium]|nr:hypothetical protein [Thermodesulfobacteriota bacterium]